METYILSAVLILIILFIIVLIMCILNNRKLRELSEYAEDGDLSEALKTYYKKINELRVMIHDASDKALSKRISSCEAQLNQCYSKMGIVNFDAFDDVSGKQSFSFALLDSSNSGVIITSLYGHSSSNTYIRKVINGVSSVKLIDEENQALSIAIKNEKGND